MSGLHPRRLVPVLLAACVLWAGGANGATDLDDHPYVPSEVILKFKSEAAKSQKAALLTELEATTLRNFHHHGLTQLHLATLSVAEAIHRYSGHPLVEYIEPNYIVTLDLFPDDPDFSLQWGLYNTGQTGGAAGSDIDALEAWDLTTDAEEVVVAIVDSGVDYNHEDLADNIYINPGEIPGNSNDDDGNGFIDDVNGWNFFIDNNNPRDVFGHGTSIAGIIGAVGNNTLGVTGIAWNVKILPVKWTSGASGSLSDALAATEYATMMGVDIMNHSWGDHFVFLPEAMLDVFTDANDAGILLVCAAGNDASNIDRDPHYPAGFDLPNIVSVAASKANDSRAGFSNYGPLSVDLAAPGEDIHSTLLDDLYGLFGVGGPYIPGTGTSFAAPFAAGALALM